MSFIGTKELNNIFVGNKEVQSVFVGNNKIYSKEVTPTSDPFLTFSSPNSFTLSVSNSTKNWDGTLEYSIDKSTWDIWTGTTVLSSSLDGQNNVIYLRGSNNTKITGGDGVQYVDYAQRWVLNGSDISCIGNIENLLDYQQVQQGIHPSMGKVCFGGLFKDCVSLISPPMLPAVTLNTCCYGGMFRGCINLLTAPELPATTLTASCYAGMFADCYSLTVAPSLPAINPDIPLYYCYSSMFENCSSLSTIPSLTSIYTAGWGYYKMFKGCSLVKISSEETAEYKNKIFIPYHRTGTGQAAIVEDMFAGTGGVFTGTPAEGRYYYTSNDLV